MIKFQQTIDNPDHGRALATEEIEAWASGFERQIKDTIRYNSPEFLSDIDDLSERIAMHMTGTMRSGKLSHAPDLVSSVSNPEWTIEVKSCHGSVPATCGTCGEVRPVALGTCHYCGDENPPVTSCGASYQHMVDRDTDDAYIVVRPAIPHSSYEDGGLKSMELRLSFFVLDKDDPSFSAFLQQQSSMGFDSITFWSCGPCKIAEFSVEYDDGFVEVSSVFYNVLNSESEPVPTSKLHVSELKTLLSGFEVDKLYKKCKSDLVSLLEGFGISAVPRSQSSTCATAVGRLTSC